MKMQGQQQDVLQRIWIVTGAEDFVEFPILEEFDQSNDFPVDRDSEALEGLQAP
jgi:hypothetical protein